jgi:hypothetical protein
MIGASLPGAVPSIRCGGLRRQGWHVCFFPGFAFSRRQRGISVQETSSLALRTVGLYDQRMSMAYCKCNKEYLLKQQADERTLLWIKRNPLEK